MKYLGYIWAFPWTLLVFLFYFLPFTLLGWYKFHGVEGDGLVFVHGDMPSWLKRMWEGWGGQSFGNCIITRYVPYSCPAANIVLIHELEHTRQAMIYGPLFPIVYVLSCLTAALAGEHFYKMNHFEIAARRKAGQPIV